ncbi:GSCFA domain-containing protein [Nostoc punctiforme UO1]|uniref:GSCFA domain-containing protein n=1 Tax=Nostoc punctiforme TaxID=272131 RepID=UPI0030A312B3
MNIFNEEKALIINEGSEITNIETLKLIIKSILNASEVELYEEKIINFLILNQEYLSSHDAVNEGIKTYLNIEASRIDNFSIKKILTKLLQHELQTTENRLAYYPYSKPNASSVFWPDPTHIKYPRSIFDELPYACENKIIDKLTPIGSAGSCFAMEIAHRLQQKTYNYIVTEKNIHSCANWGIIFNTPSFCQLIEKAFGLRKTPKLLWAKMSNAKLAFCDPFREDIEFNSLEDYTNDYYTHIERVREALLRVKVFVITLGMNEVWTLKSDGSVFSRCPWGFAASLVERKVLTVEENVYNLQKMLDIWRIYNPEIKLIVSVSPIPLHATFRGDNFHVVTGNCHSKSILRVAAEEFVSRNKNVFYFPAYETVLYCTDQPWAEDQRHVSRGAVDNVMKLFDKIFVNEEAESTYKSYATFSAELKLREFNFIIFPDWNQSEESLQHDLENVIRAMMNYTNKNRTTLLIDASSVSEAEIEILVSSVVMNILMEEDLISSELPEISLISQLSDNQWESILPHLNARIALKQENQLMSAQERAASLPIWESVT